MSIHRIAHSLLCALAVCVVAAPVVADEAEVQAQAMSRQDYEVMRSGGALRAHPDFRWRMQAMLAIEDGDEAQARELLRRAARYADKPSQALLAEMLWTGRGGSIDRPRAYAWMDLAAERGWVAFIAHREQYWNQLDAREREQALQIGREVYDEFGDDVAKPRLAHLLDRQRRKSTGSRTGANIGVRVFTAPEGNRWGGGGVAKPIGTRIAMGRELTGYYDRKLWSPERYFEWQDALYAEPATGEVTVGDIDASRAVPDEE